MFPNILKWSFRTLLTCMVLMALNLQVAAQGGEHKSMFWEGATIELTKEDGLSDTYIKKFVQDADGFLWIAGHSGLNRFDGSEVIQVEIDTSQRHTAIMDMLEDRSRNILWVATLSAIYKLDLESYNSTMVLPDTSLQEEWQMGTNFSLDLDSLGRLLIGNLEGFTILDVEHQKVISSQHREGEGKNQSFRKVYRIHPDPFSEDRFWLGTDAGLYLYLLSTDQWIPMRSGLSKDFKLRVIRHIYYVEGQDQFIVSNDEQDPQHAHAQYFVFNREREEFEQMISIGRGWTTTGVFRGDDQKLYLSTTHATGLYCIIDQTLDTVYHSFSPQDPARIDFLDRDQQIWSSLPGKVKTFRAITPAVKHYSYQTDKPSAYHVCTDLDRVEDGLLMSVFGGDGIYHFNLVNEQWEIIKPAYSTEEEMLRYSGIDAAPDGRLIAFGYDGNYVVRDNTLHRLPGKQGSTHLGQAAVDRNGVIWGFNKRQITTIDLKNGLIRSYPDETADCNVKRRAFTTEKDVLGNIWIVGICTGFVHYDLKKQQFSHSRNLGFDERMDRYIATILSHGNHVYVISDDALVGEMDVRNVRKGYSRIIDIGKIAHIRGLTISTATISPDGCIWALTEQGLLKITPGEWTVSLFDEGDGIMIKDEELGVFTAEQMLVIDPTTLVYSTRKSLHLVDMENLRSTSSPPKSYLSNLLVNNETYQSDTIALKKGFYSFSTKEDYLTFEFSAVEFDRPAQTRFAYQLEDIDDDWVYSTRKNVTYAHLGGGDYTFRLMADRNDGNWSTPQVVRIRIQQEWYETQFARIAGILFLVGSIYMIYRFRVDRAIKEQKLKTRYERRLAEVKMNALTAQMNPHFIFNSLNSIDYYIIKNDTHKASEYLNRFARLIRMILNHSRSNYISLGDELEALKLYLEIESIRFSQKFEYVVEAAPDADLENTRIPPMLFQPYVENAIWHGLMHKSEKGRLSVQVKLSADGTRLIGIVEDNGIGRAMAEELKSKSARLKSSKSMGMSITKDKLEVINVLHNLDAHAAIEDLIGSDGKAAGTRVILTVPI